MQRSLSSTLARGAAAGVAAGIVQVALGKAEDVLLLPPRENADFAPRLVKRLAKGVGVHTSEMAEWALGTAFHFGYAAFWGAGYAPARERSGVHPLAGGTLLGALIYGMTFPRWGGAVQTGVERPPRRRTPQMKFLVASVTLGFGLATAFVYERIRGPTPS